MVLLLFSGCAPGAAKPTTPTVEPASAIPTKTTQPTATVADDEASGVADQQSTDRSGAESQVDAPQASAKATPSAAGAEHDDAPATVEAATAPEPDAVAVSATGAEAALDEAMGDGLPLNSTTNILLLGSDRRPDTPNWRTDVIMIVAIDFEGKKAGVLSIPRDVYVDEIPDHYPNRVNVIDYLGEQDEPDGGGPALFARIIEAKMGVPIDHYVRFDFSAFREIVNALDGVDVEVDCAFSGFIEDEGGWLVLDPGVHRLDGNQSMIYVRSRQLGGDLDRARRQQRFVWAVRNQVFSEKLLTGAPSLYAAMSDSIQTNIGLVQALRFARFVLDLGTDDIHGMVLTPPDLLESGWRGGMSVFVPNWALIQSEVQMVFERPPFALTNTIGPDGDISYCP